MIDSYLTIKDLYAISTGGKESYPVGTYQGAKGRSIYLNVLEKISSLSLIELKPGLGSRGGHKHLHKTECFYLVSGRIRGQYWLEDPEFIQQETDHSAGQLIIIKPGLFHLFTPLTDAWAVEFSEFPHNLEDAAPAQQLPQ